MLILDLTQNLLAWRKWNWNKFMTYLFCLQVILTCVAICGISGNSLTLLAVGTNRKLWTAPNSFVVNLAIADLYVCLIHVPVALAYDLSPPPTRFCYWLGFATVLCQTISVSILSMIALNRYTYSFTSKGTYQKIYTFKYTLGMNLGVWVVVAVITSPPFYGWAEYGWNYQSRSCALVENTEAYWFALILPDTIVRLPTIIVTVVCYTHIMLKFYRSYRRTQPQHRSQSSSNTEACSNMNTSKFIHFFQISVTDDYVITFVSCHP